MTMLHYQVYDLHVDGEKGESDGRFGRLRQTGTMPVTSTATTPTSLSQAGSGAHTVVVVRSLVPSGGTDLIYVEQRRLDDPAHSSSAAMSAHAATDPLAKRLLRPGEDATLKMTGGGTFSAVIAAAVT